MHIQEATRFLTNINRAGAIAASMNFNPEQENAMGAKSKAGKVRGTVLKHAVKAPGRRGRKHKTVPESWEQTAEIPEERDAEIDCQRIVTADGGRSLPLYYDDYN